MAAGQFHVVLGGASDLADARHSLSDWLLAIPVPANVAADLVTAAGELCANGVRAAKSKVELSARLHARSVVVEVKDDGEGMAGEVPEEPPAPTAESGRGLYVVRQLVDVLWVTKVENGPGTRATFARRLEG